MLRKALLVILSVFVLCDIVAQEKQDKNLTLLLKNLSKSKSVHISFSPNLTNGIYPRKTSLDGSVGDVLTRFTEDAPLNFKMVNHKLYYIFKQEKVVELPPPPVIPEPIIEEPVVEIIEHDTTPPTGLGYEPQQAARLIVRNTYPVKRMKVVFPAPPCKLVVKTNLLYLTMPSINAGAELTLFDRTSVDLSINTSFWKKSDESRMNHFLIQPEIRRWKHKNMNGQFWGAHLFYAKYNIGGMLPWGYGSGKIVGLLESNAIMNYSHKGSIKGVGVSYGHRWSMKKNLRLEASVGVGYAHLKYDQYNCIGCSEIRDHEARYYFGPTKAAISLVYVIR